MTGRFSGALHKSNLTKMLLNEIDREYPRKRAGISGGRRAEGGGGEPIVTLLIQPYDFPPKHTDCKNDNDTCGN